MLRHTQKTENIYILYDYHNVKKKLKYDNLHYSSDLIAMMVKDENK